MLLRILHIRKYKTGEMILMKTSKRIMYIPTIQVLKFRSMSRSSII